MAVSVHSQTKLARHSWSVSLCSVLFVSKARNSPRGFSGFSKDAVKFRDGDGERKNNQCWKEEFSQAGIFVHLCSGSEIQAWRDSLGKDDCFSLPWLPVLTLQRSATTFDKYAFSLLLSSLSNRLLAIPPCVNSVPFLFPRSCPLFSSTAYKNTAQHFSTLLFLLVRTLIPTYLYLPSCIWDHIYCHPFSLHTDYSKSANWTFLPTNPEIIFERS